MSQISYAEYGRTCDGILAARVGDQAFAMVPTDNGYHLVKAWGLKGAIEDWTVADFYSGRDTAIDEAGFREAVDEWISHKQQLAALDRHSIVARRSTPWGTPQHSVGYAGGVTVHQTASHGGFELSTERNAKVHQLLRSNDGFYEVAPGPQLKTPPDLFTDLERRDADEMLKQVYPDAWEAVRELTLDPGRSRAKDRRAFETENS